MVLVSGGASREVTLFALGTTLDKPDYFKLLLSRRLPSNANKAAYTINFVSAWQVAIKNAKWQTGEKDYLKWALKMEKAMMAAFPDDYYLLK